ncbi:hypothetical protein A2856_01440 [Candidatus Uhrbacteria bacterium RIFCSPHIGHO2_01_FULL_63_20]|uniref:Glycosyltransferase RgtA/B/C/D-like domain-containing protein n=1 Tax=Candidatus Uhrbacteria bacterium RIFCSPHIGHO2_01_FULL_63_20 TaxID=1802385 RepID=A0A1F7TK07_9BACT|nr:MAG: hypothetical protein A2856_01440 [Candidatus Uhrbacteria bacterium RIFCSPHIGHO2_01_FULL_63_20]
MFRVFSRFYPTIFGLVFLAGWIGNAFFLQSTALGIALLALWLVLCGTLVGRAAAPQEHPALQLPLGAWLLLSGVMIVGAAVYYAWLYPPELAFALAFLSVPISLWLGNGTHRSWVARFTHDLWRERAHRLNGPAAAAAGACLFFLALAVRAFADGATTEAIRSAWLVVDPSAFVALFVAFALLAALLLRGQGRAIALPLACAALFAFLSVAALVFPLGFGFDPFIHRATMDHVVQFGTIEPKPFYYVGQYALELFLVHAFSIPVLASDVWLLPILAALLIPPALYGAAAHLTRDRRVAAACAFAAFLLPLSSFIVTTPQGLANLWTLLLALFAVPTLMGFERPRLPLLALGALAALLTHPIAGLPALLFVALALAHVAGAGRFKVASRAAFWTITVAGSVILPSAFVVNALRSGTGPGFDLSALDPARVVEALHLGLFLQNGFRPLLDFAELWAQNGFAVVLLLAALGAWKSRREGVMKPFLAMAAALGINYLLLSTAVDFSFLIDYERQNYAQRLVPLIAFFLAPPLLVALAAVCTRVRVSPIGIRVFAVLLAAAIATAALYSTYPRHDAFVVGHGINVSQGDIHAAYEIERASDGRPYVTLANQSVSAAAIRTLGFQDRYWGETFFYPVPTGSDLYQVFLDMNDAPAKETALRALDVVSASCEAGCMRELPTSVFFVVNDYWWQSDRIVEQAKGTADDWFAVDGGALIVFRYDAE